MKHYLHFNQCMLAMVHLIYCRLEERFQVKLNGYHLSSFTLFFHNGLVAMETFILNVEIKCKKKRERDNGLVFWRQGEKCVVGWGFSVALKVCGGNCTTFEWK